MKQAYAREIMADAMFAFPSTVSAAALLLAATVLAQHDGRARRAGVRIMRQAQRLMGRQIRRRAAIYTRKRQQPGRHAARPDEQGAEAKKYFRRRSMPRRTRRPRPARSAPWPCLRLRRRLPQHREVRADGDRLLGHARTGRAAECLLPEGEMANKQRGSASMRATWRPPPLLYQGRELGLKAGQPNASASLWKFRLEHALARIAARRASG